MKHALCCENIRGNKTEDEEGSEKVKLDSALMGVCSSIECICIMVVLICVGSVFTMRLFILYQFEFALFIGNTRGWLKLDLTKLEGADSRFH